MLDTFTLGHGGSHLVASLNVISQNAVGLALVWAGYTVAVMLH
jgi:fluoride ion exporter CrcB/FEX